MLFRKLAARVSFGNLAAATNNRLSATGTTLGETAKQNSFSATPVKRNSFSANAGKRNSLFASACALPARRWCSSHLGGEPPFYAWHVL